jgi:hypothetical protein
MQYKKHIEQSVEAILDGFKESVNDALSTLRDKSFIKDTIEEIQEAFSGDLTFMIERGCEVIARDLKDYYNGY